MTGGVGAPVLAAVLVLAATVLHRGPDPRRRLVRFADASGCSAPRADLCFAAVRVLRSTLRLRPRRDAADAGSLVEVWAAQLRGGRPVDVALADALHDLPSIASVLSRTRATLAVGGDVAAALRADSAALSDDSARRAVVAAAACWTVAHRNGAQLADSLDRVGAAVRADETHVAQVRAELAGPRSTARLLAALPLLALAMSSALGLGPLDALLTTAVGRLAVVGGVLLDVLGLWWTARIARAAERAI